MFRFYFPRISIYFLFLYNCFNYYLCPRDVLSFLKLRGVMGEATPAQSAAGTFVPMLGVGLGALAGGGGPAVLGAPASRGSAVPQLKNAIVERLRARIESCRQHHSTCENRYQRGQHETSDREHKSTLHLLNIIHQGPGNRKVKGGRGSNQQPPDYSRADSRELKGPDGEQKILTRIAVSWAREFAALLVIYLRTQLKKTLYSLIE